MILYIDHCRKKTMFSTKIQESILFLDTDTVEWKYYLSSLIGKPSAFPGNKNSIGLPCTVAILKY